MMIQNTSIFRYLFIMAVIFSACSGLPDKPWVASVPHDATGVITYDENTTINGVLETSYISFLDDISPAAIPIIESIADSSGGQISVEAMVLYPSMSTDWYPVWITSSAGENFLEKIAGSFYQPFFVNNYQFNGLTIHKLSIRNRVLFATELNNTVLFSESSYAIEQHIRAYTDEIPSLSLSSDAVQPETLYLNGEGMDNWISQLSAIKLRPLTLRSFEGLGVGAFDLTRIEDQEDSRDLILEGSQPVGKEQSSLVKAISGEPNEITLDRYISGDAAAFTILHHIPTIEPADYKLVSPMDSALAEDPELFDRFAEKLQSEFAFVSFPSSSFSGLGEYLFIRKVNEPRSLYPVLDQLDDQGIIKRVNDSYYINSTMFSHLIGTPLSTFQSFYLTMTGDAMVISPRLGLSERIRADRSRRRVIYYNSTYADMRKQFEEEVSMLFYAENEPLQSFLRDKLHPDNTLNTFINQFELSMGTGIASNTDSTINWSIKTFKTEKSTLPYEEQWISPLDGGDITAEPVLADIGGSAENEVIVATDRGTVYGIAGDGTVLFQASTEGDTPIGNPIVYDWYGNNQLAVIIGAGDKIYGWNTNGDMLPQFPFQLEEDLAAPIRVADVTRDGIAEVLATTTDRNVHVLDGRGMNLEGYPVKTNAVVNQPLNLYRFNDEWTIQASAGNGIFMWDQKGRLLNGFPLFLSSSVSTPTNFDDDVMLFGANDGHVYSVGPKRIFTDSLNVLRETPMDTLTDQVHVGAVYVSNSPISGQPVTENIRIAADSASTYTGTGIITQSANGLVSILSDNGRVLMQKNMGQPSAENHHPLIGDLYNDGKPELLSVAGFGRLYAWEILRGTRMYNIPTSSVSYPIITDLTGGSNKELIAQTRSGLRCWTIYKMDD